jgi:putative hydrolase of the HAD superfamily
MIKNILFDLGSVIMTIDQPQAVRRFKEIGLKDAETRLDPYTQKGIFGELEEGKIDAETFRLELSKIIGCEVTHDECLYAWRGYCKEVPPRNLKALRQLRSEGYRLILLSNTNPYMMEWAMSSSFDGMGNSIDSYFDMSFRSYECGMMKPSRAFFQHVLDKSGIAAEETLFLDDGKANVESAAELGIKPFLTLNGEDWTKEIYNYLR